MHYSTYLLMALPAVLAAPYAAPADVTGDSDLNDVGKRQNVAGYWQGHCFGASLDHGDTDSSHDALRDWAASGPIISTGDHNMYQYFKAGDVIAYACTDDHDGSNFFNQADVDAAYFAMDAACPRYTSGYAIYVEDVLFGTTNTGKIIGKDTGEHPVCQNFNGGPPK